MWASQRRSGEHRGALSRNGVWRKGSALRSLIRSTQMSYPVVGLASMKASNCASEDQELGAWKFSLVVKRSRPPLPSASCQNRFTAPFLFDSNAIRLPSGVHVGLPFVFPSNVNRLIVSRERSYSQI